MIGLTLIVVIVACATTSSATNVAECPGGKVSENPIQVEITACKDPPCILRRKTDIDVYLKFTTDHEVSRLITTVWATILGVPLPFIGVNGIDACDKIYNVDGSKAACPLAKGKEYVYRNSFPVREIYPRVNLVVHWALQEGDRNIACFEAPSRIVG